MTTPAARLVPVLVLALLCSSCGTAVYSHRIEITVSNPGGAGGEHRVSVFDHTMGYSREWAEKAMGVARPSQPYAGTFTSTGTATMFKHDLPRRLDIAFVVPAVSGDGYFLFQPDLPAAEIRDGVAKFVRFGEYFPDANARSVPVRYSASPEKHGWRVRLDVQ